MLPAAAQEVLHDANRSGALRHKLQKLFRIVALESNVISVDHDPITPSNDGLFWSRSVHRPRWTVGRARQLRVS
jgi:hypothetical protein